MTSGQLALFLVATLFIILTACSTPPHNRVRDGAEPFHEDKSVAFRTTYYFRVFDYCVVKRMADGRQVLVPRIDSLYRFRMTGKGSTLLQNVKFESGTLRAQEIDPFGARIVRDPNTGQLRFQSRQETDELIKREAAFAEFNRLLKRYESLQKKSEDTPSSVPPNTLALLAKAIKKALRGFSGISAPDATLLPAFATHGIKRTTDDSTKETVITFNLEMLSPHRAVYPVSVTFNSQGKLTDHEIQEGKNLIDGQAKTPKLRLQPESSIKTDPANATSFTLIFEDDYKAATSLRIDSTPSVESTAIPDKSVPSVSLGTTKMLVSSHPAAIGDPPPRIQFIDRPTEIQCPEGAPTRRGFQILGPEGWRTFNQDERLVMAMTTDAQPLISTLRDISGRILNASSSAESVLLPISEARRKLAEAELILDRPLPDDKTTPDKIAERVSDALNKK